MDAKPKPRFVVTIPADHEIEFGVMDDVDDDGHRYYRTIDGPAEVTIELVEGPEWMGGTFYEVAGEALSVSVHDVPDEWMRRLA